MPVVKGIGKGVIAVSAGFVAQEVGYLPSLVLGGQFGALGQYLGFVIGTFGGLLVADLLAWDISPGRPVLGFVKGLSAALGAAVPLVYLADFGLFLSLCNGPLGESLEVVVGAGRCHAYLKMVAGTFVGVLIGDLLHAPFRG